MDDNYHCSDASLEYNDNDYDIRILILKTHGI